MEYREKNCVSCKHTFSSSENLMMMIMIIIIIIIIIIKQFEAKAKDIRGKLSKAKAELKKITKKSKEESRTDDERMRNTFDCMPCIIYGEGEIKSEKINARLQGQSKTEKGKRTEQTLSFGCWSSLLEL